MRRWLPRFASTRRQEKEVLRQLLRGSATGRQIADRSGGILRRWNVYSRLEALERRGFVKANREQDRPTLYEITAEGCEEAPGDGMMRQIRALELRGYQVTATYRQAGKLTGATLERRRSDRPERIEAVELESFRSAS